MLAGAGALAAASLVPLASRAAPRGADAAIVLRASSGRARLAGPDRPDTEIWGYGGRVPGPPVVVTQGEEVYARLVNDLPQPTTIHWHGVRLDNAMDGVPDLTQAAVAPGARFDYRFRPPDAGSFWYHPHELASEQMGRGLYGPLIVQERIPPPADQDLLVLLDDWRLDRQGRIDTGFGDLHDAAHMGRLGNVLTINGAREFAIRARARERIRLRLFNVANARIMGLRLSDHEPVIVAIDGQPVAPRAPRNATVVLAPGQRADVLMDMVHLPGKTAPLMIILEDGEVEIGKIIYHAYDLARDDPLPAVAALPPNLAATPFSAGDARRAEIVMQGGAMGRFRDTSMYKGERFDRAGLIEQGQVWTFNGTAALPKQPLFAVRRGEPVAILFRNDTRWPHAMHVHGHHFRELDSEGSVSPVWHDTVLIGPTESRTVALVADNPGKWLIHCHMIEHHAAGMATWFSVGV